MNRYFIYQQFSQKLIKLIVFIVFCIIVFGCTTTPNDTDKNSDNTVTISGKIMAGISDTKGGSDYNIYMVSLKDGYVTVFSEKKYKDEESVILTGEIITFTFEKNEYGVYVFASLCSQLGDFLIEKKLTYEHSADTIAAVTIGTNRPLIKETGKIIFLIEK